MYGAAVALVILQQPDKAKSQLKNINGITWNMQVCRPAACETFQCRHAVILLVVCCMN